MRINGCSYLSVLHSQYLGCMLSRMCLAKAILGWSEQILLFNKRLNSFKQYFFKDPVEIRKQSDRPIIVNAVSSSCLKIGIIFAIFSFNVSKRDELQLK